MSLTNRILLAMLAGITLGSALEWLMGVIDPESGLHGFIQNGLILGFSMFWAGSSSHRSSFWSCLW